VDLLAHEAAEVKRLVLSRDARLSRVQAMRLADLPAEERRRAVRHLVETGKLLDSDGKRMTKTKVLLPRKPRDFAAGAGCLLGFPRCLQTPPPPPPSANRGGKG